MVGRISPWLWKAVPVAIGIALSICAIVWAVGSGPKFDLDAYWLAAMRLRGGEAIYNSAGLEDVLAYRYAPWFAAAWVPLTYLPQPLVFAAWRIALFAAVAWLALGPANPWLKALTLPFLALAAWWGNVHPLMVALLVWGVHRRTGPFVVAVAASLKFTPGLLALVYLGRRQWARFSIALAITVLLLIPMLAFDLAGYAADPSGSLSLWWQVGPLAWAIIAAVTATLVLVRPSWVVSAIAVIAAIPRLLLYDFGLLLVSANDQHSSGGRSDGSLGS